jgi:hypothetical protein
LLLRFSPVRQPKIIRDIERFFPLDGITMWGTIVPFLAFLFLTAGAMLLYDGFSTSDLTQTTKVIGGASLLSLGFVGLWFCVKNWWKWRTVYKEYRNQ